MNRCNGCDGIACIDCFNPIECEQISRAILLYDEHGIAEMEERQEHPVWYPGIAYQPLFDHMYDTHGVILTTGEMDDIMHIISKMDE